MAVWILTAAAPPARAQDFEPETFFSTRCSACHSVGHGEVVGPDLRGVTTRHGRPWLRSFIRSSQAVVRAGDREAVALFTRYRKVMPDHDLTPEQIDALLDFIQKGGPRDGSEVRLASAASPAEVALGRALFEGGARFANGGAACMGCHVAGEAKLLVGGSLACDLRSAYRKYGDWGLARAIAEPRFPLMAEIYAGRPLTEREAFAVKAFLYQASRTPGRPGEGGPLRLPLFGFGSSALVLWLAGRDPRGRV